MIRTKNLKIWKLSLTNWLLPFRANTVFTAYGTYISLIVPKCVGKIHHHSQFVLLSSDFFQQVSWSKPYNREGIQVTIVVKTLWQDDAKWIVKNKSVNCIPLEIFGASSIYRFFQFVIQWKERLIVNLNLLIGAACQSYPIVCLFPGGVHTRFIRVCVTGWTDRETERQRERDTFICTT